MVSEEITNFQNYKGLPKGKGPLNNKFEFGGQNLLETALEGTTPGLARDYEVKSKDKSQKNSNKFYAPFADESGDNIMADDAKNLVASRLQKPGDPGIYTGLSESEYQTIGANGSFNLSPQTLPYVRVEATGDYFNEKKANSYTGINDLK